MQMLTQVLARCGYAVIANSLAQNRTEYTYETNGKVGRACRPWFVWYHGLPLPVPDTALIENIELSLLVVAIDRTNIAPLHD